MNDGCPPAAFGGALGPRPQGDKSRVIVRSGERLRNPRQGSESITVDMILNSVFDLQAPPRQFSILPPFCTLQCSIIKAAALWFTYHVHAYNVINLHFSAVPGFKIIAFITLYTSLHIIYLSHVGNLIPFTGWAHNAHSVLFEQS